MKKHYVYSMMPLALLMVLSLFSVSTFAQTSQNNSQISSTVYSFKVAKNNRILRRMQKEAKIIKQTGGMTAIGISNSNASKLDEGRQKAYVDALENLSQQMGTRIEVSSIYQTRDSTHKVSTLSKVYSTMSFQKAKIVDFQYFQSRDEKKSGLVTCYILVSVNKKDVEEMGRKERQMKTEYDFEKFNKTFKSFIDSTKKQ